MLKLLVKSWTKTILLAVPLDKVLAGSLGYSVYGREHIYNRVGNWRPFSLCYLHLLLSLTSTFIFDPSFTFYSPSVHFSTLARTLV